MSSAEEIRARYEKAKLRSRRKTGLYMAIAGLAGLVITVAAAVFLAPGDKEAAKWFAPVVTGFFGVSFVATLAGIKGIVTGSNALSDVEENVRGPLQ